MQEISQSIIPQKKETRWICPDHTFLQPWGVSGQLSLYSSQSASFSKCPEALMAVGTVILQGTGLIGYLIHNSALPAASLHVS